MWPKIITVPFYSTMLNLPSSMEDARLRLYRQVDPTWGYTDDTLKGSIQSLLYGKNDFFGDGDRIYRDPWSETVYADYLRIPQKYRKHNYSLQKSKYKPTKGDNLNHQYYKIAGTPETPNQPYMFTKQLIDEGLSLRRGQNKNTNIFESANMGTSTIGRGTDDKGDYISYYDEWDLNPIAGSHSDVSWKDNKIVNMLGLNKANSGDMSFGLGSPLYFYDRIHLDDWFGIDSSARPGTYYGGYLPEIVIKPRKK